MGTFDDDGLHDAVVNRLELLEQFYQRDHLPNCTGFLADWKVEERTFGAYYLKNTAVLIQIICSHNGLPLRGSLTLDQEEALDAMFEEIGLDSLAPQKALSHVKDLRTPFDSEYTSETLEHQRQKMAHWSVRNLESGHPPSTTSNILLYPLSEVSNKEGSGDRPKKVMDEYKAATKTPFNCLGLRQ
jgi:hypothetical protein